MMPLKLVDSKLIDGKLEFLKCYFKKDIFIRITGIVTISF